MRMSDWSADVCSSDLATWAGVTRYLRRPVAMTRYVTEASEMMRERATTHVEAVQRVMDAEAGRLKAGPAAMLRWGYFLLGQIQRTLDVSTWLAPAATGLELFAGDVDRARSYADDLIVRAKATQEFRSEELRVENACVILFRSWLSMLHSIKKL